MEKDKKKEWSTYKRLNLQRKHKSRAKREAVEKQGMYCFIGGQEGRPYLKVLKTDYLRFFREEKKIKANCLRALDRNNSRRFRFSKYPNHGFSNAKCMSVCTQLQLACKLKPS